MASCLKTVPKSLRVLAHMLVCFSRNTILPEIFARVLFSLNFADGEGPRKLIARNFCTLKNFDRVEIITICTWCDFVHTVELLLCSSFSFLNKLLTTSLHRYLQPASNKRQGPEWACLTYCTQAESSYLNAKLASADLLFVKRLACQANSR